MFPNVGKELKNWAKFFFFVIFIPFCLMALVVFCRFIGRGPKAFFGGLIVSAIIGVVGYFIARLSCILLYAFGELVDSNMEISRKLSAYNAVNGEQYREKQECGYEQNPDPQHVQQEVDEKVENEGWCCFYCGTKNDADATSCSLCGGEMKV